MTTIEEIIKERGPILSSELLEILLEEDKDLSYEAARKRLTRLDPRIYKLKGYFSKGQVLLYDKDAYGSEEYFRRIISSLKKAGKQYFYLYQAINFHYGCIDYSHLATYGVNPVKDTKGHVTFDTAIAKLLSLKLVSKVDNNIISFLEVVNFRHAKAVETAKGLLLLQFSDWARNIALTSYNTARFYSDFKNLQFAFVSPSYIATITRFADGVLNPGFIVADVLIGNTIDEGEVEFFIKKVDILRSQRGTPTFLPFLLVENVELEALKRLKSKGVIVGFIHELFGQQYTELLQSLINVVTNAGAILKKNPEQYLSLMAKLTKLVEGKTNNLRGDLFELAVGYFHGKQCNSLDIGRLINFEGQQREIDVLAIYPDRVMIAECKGYNNPIKLEEIDRWLSYKIPVIRKWVKDQDLLKNRRIIFEFWSTGGFEIQAEDILKQTKAKENPNKFQIEYYSKDQMLKKSREVNSKKFSDILKEYFIKEV